MIIAGFKGLKPVGGSAYILCRLEMCAICVRALFVRVHAFYTHSHCTARH